MGVLLFSSGKTKEALEYLTRARDLNENTASLYQYLGLCYEEIGNINEAAAYYEKAIMIDPNDINIISGLERVKGKIENEKNKWKQPEQKNESEAELGEKIPLPITKSAIDVRMTDEEAKKMEEKENKENKEVNKKP
jgi:tetratricopeptide (TPR) repeat protein